jgi:hypothetical protein
VEERKKGEKAEEVATMIFLSERRNESNLKRKILCI